MADPTSKALAAAAEMPKQTPDSPEVAALRFQQKELTEKVARLKALPESKEHEHAAAIKRTEDQLARVDAALKGK